MNRLEEIEAIKQLKGRYFRGLDCKDWALFRSVFTDDFNGNYGDSDAEKFNSGDAIVEQMKAMLADAVTVHHGHTPEIEIIDETSAKGIWAMEDIVEHADFKLQGWGHYHETYRKLEGEWKIASVQLARLKLVFG